MVALPPGGLLVENAGKTLQAIQRFVVERDPRTFHPALEVEIAGPLVTSIRTQEVLQRDLTLLASSIKSGASRCSSAASARRSPKRR